jgi:formamidopyrimidine-DNA glycosylase
MTVRMYGFFLCFQEGDCPNDSVRVALERPSPLTGGFTPEYFLALVREALQQKKNLSVKAMLATEQRIPGLGNGVLQDILFSARIHPKRKAAGLSDAALEALYDSTKRTLAQMAIQGGRDTESDIYGVKGGYQTILSSKRAGQPCPVCGETVVKEAYMGGSVYYCPTCQALEK